METKKSSTPKILALIGSSILTLAALFLSGSAQAGTSSSSSAAVASFTGVDTGTQGNWRGKYGFDGYSIANDSQSVPSYATLAVQNESNWTWASGTSDPRALESGVTSGRIAATWFSASTFNFDVNLTDGNAHQVAVYALDWDQYLGGRAETIQIVDANSGTVLDSRSISAFSNGLYLVWNVTGHVHINVTMNAGGNGVISGVFFGPTTMPQFKPAVASFAALDKTTEGNWMGAYGSDGYSIANSSQSIPSYATFAVQNESNWTWAGSTTDPRALETTSGRIAATWFNVSAFNFDINLTDGNSHQIAVYALDWDAYEGGRAETIQVTDANTGAVLDTRSVSAFTTGQYLVWNVTGHVHTSATMNAGGNAVISGVFFASAKSTAAPAGIAPAITTQPNGTTVIVGQAATFAVANTGTAPMTYQWLKNGAAIGGATTSSYTTPATAASDNGSQFTVVVSNGIGSVTSSAATLTVNSGTLILNASASSLSFGSVNVSSSSVQSVSFTNAGTANVTISNVSVSGAGFNATGMSAGTILAPGQTATLSTTFAPAASGSVTGSVTVSSNASSGAKVVTLAGTGLAAPVAHTVTLGWSPSTSTVVGYNVYVSTVSGSSYTKLTSSPVAVTGYTDAGLETAQTRYYVVTSVDTNNNESVYSTQVSAIVP